ncbi:reverse transcriptase domain-containing protein [Tanacetum coccineum]
MVTPVEKRSSNKFCDFHNDKGHNTDECMQSKKQIKELVPAGKLSHLIKEIKQGRDQTKVGKKEAPTKDKSLAIYMVQPWHRMTRQKVTQSFACVSEITFPPLTTTKGTESGNWRTHDQPHVCRRGFLNRSALRALLQPALTQNQEPNGDADHSTKAWMNFMIVRSLSPYNGIIGRPRIREIQAVPSTAHGMLKFPVDGGIVTIRSTILIPAECATVTTSSKKILREAEVRHENLKVALHPNFPDQEVAIRGTLSVKGRTELCSLLKENLDIFAWQPIDMTGVPRYRLNIREGYSPVRQKKRGQAPERAKAIQAEVQKLVEAGIMREVYYHDWLSNPVMVKKHDGSWRMCVDFTDLNKACPQDCYPLPEIDWKVESLCGYPFKCFLDAYKGYHQIQMAESDEEKTAFHTNQGVYCYTKMPFGLKNAGATYQRLVDKAFDSQVGRNIEVYVDDLVIKSHTEAEMLRDIDETFRTLRKINMKLNPNKCTFGTVEGMFLGFLSKSATKSLSLFKTLKKCIKKSDFHWTPEAEQAFKQLKQHLSELPLLVAPKPKEELIVYMSTSYGAISAVLMTERGTILVDFLVEKPDEAPTDTSVVETPQEPWTLFTDGSSCVDGSGVDLILTSLGEQILKEISIQEEEVALVVEEEEGPTWMTPIIEYLKDGTLPDDRKEASKLRIRARQYELKGQVFNSLYGLFHEVDRGESRGDNHRQSGEEVRVRQHMKHPQSNRLVKRANRSLSEGIKARLGERNKNWIEELPHVLWAHRTMIKSSHGDTPFSLTYGTEAIIPAKIGMPTYCTAEVDTVYNDAELRLNLNLLKERRERATIREAKDKLKMTKYYNARVRGVTFRPRDFVYRSNEASHAMDGGKLSQKWEGPYEVTEALGDGAYKLRSMDGAVLPRTWNIANLKEMLSLTRQG